MSNITYEHSGCCGSEVAQALILNKIPGFAKPSHNQITNFKCLLFTK
ncbi:MAG TPA: hypothetical protein VKA34_10860 [Balneolales bacterium]|nr:hypothetical protein [Balneolales bacterium]